MRKYLRSATIRLAHGSPELRSVLLPLLAKEAAAVSRGPLEILASKEVGMPGSPFVFVTVRGRVRAVFTRGRRDLAAAIKFARSLPGGFSEEMGSDVLVEDETGVAWDQQEG